MHITNSYSIVILLACTISGWHDHSNKWRTWDSIPTIRLKASEALLCFVDFTEIMSTVEKGGDARRIDNICACLDDCGIQDLGF